MSFKSEIKKMITYIARNVIVPVIAKYITEPIQLKDGRVVQGQEAFDMAVEQDKDLYDLVVRYRPELLKYAEMIDFSYVDWDSMSLTKDAVRLLKKNGISVDKRGEEYIYRQIENFRVKLIG